MFSYAFDSASSKTIAGIRILVSGTSESERESKSKTEVCVCWKAKLPILNKTLTRLRYFRSALVNIFIFIAGSGE